jgi:hypothetical protein
MMPPPGFNFGPFKKYHRQKSVYPWQKQMQASYFAVILLEIKDVALE